VIVGDVSAIDGKHATIGDTVKWVERCACALADQRNASCVSSRSVNAIRAL
jgi:hypothetical protein